MGRLITPGELAPDFELQGTTSRVVTLSEYRGNKVVLLYFLRGFM